MSDTRFAGQEATLSIVNTTTGDPLIADVLLESATVTLPFDVVKKQYMGEIGPRYRMFADGWEADIKVAPTSAPQMVELANLLVAKASGLIQDEIALQMKYVSPTGAFRIVLRDGACDGIPLDTGGGHEFLESGLKWKGQQFKIATT